MKFKSQVFTQVSGSVGGLTFAHNQGGLYTRARSIPVNPGSPQQQAVRNAFTELATGWRDTLTQDQRDGWAVYAFNSPLIDALGDPIQVAGLNMYARGNVPLLQAGQPRVDDFPVEFGLPSFTTPTINVLALTDVVTVTFDNTDAWANEEGGFMLVYASRPVSPAINFFQGPYRFAGSIAGDAVTPPTSPASIPLPFPVSGGQRVFIQVTVVRADARLASPARLTDLAGV